MAENLTVLHSGMSKCLFRHIATKLHGVWFWNKLMWTTLFICRSAHKNASIFLNISECTPTMRLKRFLKVPTRINIRTFHHMTFIHSFISIQPWRPGLAGTRAHSCDRYGSGTLHPGQILGGSLPLLSPSFRRYHFSGQVPPSTTTREILAAKGGTVGEKDVR